MLTFQFLSLVIFRKITININRLHVITWGTSLIFECLPFSTNDYGIDDIASNTRPCHIRYEKSYSYARMWNTVTFYVAMVVCLGIMSFFSICVWIWYRSSSRTEKNDKVREMISILTLYPCTMTMAWLPASIMYFRLLNTKRITFEEEIAVYVSLAFGGSYGVALAAVFFTQSREARRRWGNLIFCSNGEIDNIPLDFKDDEEVERSFASSLMSRYVSLFCSVLFCSVSVLVIHFSLDLSN